MADDSSKLIVPEIVTRSVSDITLEAKSNSAQIDVPSTKHLSDDDGNKQIPTENLESVDFLENESKEEREVNKYLMREAALGIWLEEVLELEDGKLIYLPTELADGTLVCKFMSTIKPYSIPSIFTPPTIGIDDDVPTIASTYTPSSEFIDVESQSNNNSNGNIPNQNTESQQVETETKTETEAKTESETATEAEAATTTNKESIDTTCNDAETEVKTLPIATTTETEATSVETTTDTEASTEAKIETDATNNKETIETTTETDSKVDIEATSKVDYDAEASDITTETTDVICKVVVNDIEDSSKSEENDDAKKAGNTDSERQSLQTRQKSFMVDILKGVETNFDYFKVACEECDIPAKFLNFSASKVFAGEEKDVAIVIECLCELIRNTLESPDNINLPPFNGLVDKTVLKKRMSAAATGEQFKLRQQLERIQSKMLQATNSTDVVVRRRRSTNTGKRSKVKRMRHRKSNLKALLNKGALQRLPTAATLVGDLPSLRVMRLTQDAEIVDKVTPAITRFQAIVRGRNVRKTVRKLKRNEAQRENIAKEILSTEIAYVDSLQTLSAGFLKPLREKYQFLAPISGCVEVILGYSELLLESLKERIGENWKVSSRLGDVFKQLITYLKMYSQYVKDYTSLLQQLTKLRKDEKFMATLKTLETTAKDTFESYLIRPVQRIPRYLLLLKVTKEIMKKTTTDHPDYADLAAATKEMEKVASFVNEHKRDFENMMKVCEIQSQLVGKFPNLVEPNRKFVRQEEFTCLPLKRKMQFFLFNDILLICTAKSSLAATTNKLTLRGSLKPHQANNLGRKFRVKHVIKLKNLAIEPLSGEQKPENGAGFVLSKHDEVLVTAVIYKSDAANQWIEDITELVNVINTLIAADEEDTDWNPENAKQLYQDQEDKELKKNILSQTGSISKWSKGSASDELLMAVRAEVLKQEAEKKKTSVKYIEIPNSDKSNSSAVTPNSTPVKSPTTLVPTSLIEEEQELGKRSSYRALKSVMKIKKKKSQTQTLPKKPVAADDAASSIEVRPSFLKELESSLKNGDKKVSTLPRPTKSQKPNKTKRKLRAKTLRPTKPEERRRSRSFSKETDKPSFHFTSGESIRVSSSKSAAVSSSTASNSSSDSNIKHEHGSADFLPPCPSHPPPVAPVKRPQLPTTTNRSNSNNNNNNTATRSLTAVPPRPPRKKTAPPKMLSQTAPARPLTVPAKPTIGNSRSRANNTTGQTSNTSQSRPLPSKPPSSKPPPSKPPPSIPPSKSPATIPTSAPTEKSTPPPLQRQTMAIKDLRKSLRMESTSTPTTQTEANTT